ncbi:MAG TPA: hypothetical protein VD962_02390 [Rubricoccaceae bacterium]|nr:hypothetical protein [Rubricoccaceae bacterium]
MLHPSEGPAAPPADDLGAIRFRRVRDVSDVLNTTFAFLRENFRELGLGLLTIAGPPLLLVALASSYVLGMVMNPEALMPDPAATPDELLSGPFGELIVGYFGLAVLAMVGFLLLYAVGYAYVRLYREGLAGEITPGVLWGAARRVIGPILGTSVVLTVVVFLSALVNVIPCLGTLAWLAGLVYAMPIFTLLYVARLFEGRGLGDGLRRTRTLMQGRWGPSFGIVAISLIIAWVIQTALSFPTSMALMGYMMNSLEGEGSSLGTGQRVLMAFGSVLSALGYFAFMIPLVASVFQFFSLVEQKEGAALLEEIEAIGRETDLAPAEPRRPAAPPSGTTAPGDDEDLSRGFGRTEG